MMKNANPRRDFFAQGTGRKAHIVLCLEIQSEARLHTEE